ncbi:unnamed protein product [Oikopleura dioica]|uniref:Uncharacterized protein n=1 Tax=Oikopleura dioica TaxID=34765 RepID=E4WQP7_OIKDI|nr:unnamed protein product [Oikopleura dioica]
MTKGRFLFPRRSLYSSKAQRQRQNPIFSHPAHPKQSLLRRTFLYPTTLLRPAQQHKTEAGKTFDELGSTFFPIKCSNCWHRKTPCHYSPSCLPKRRLRLKETVVEINHHLYLQND